MPRCHLRVCLQGSGKFEQALLRLMGKEKDEAVHIDSAEKMGQLELAKHIPSEVWPPPNAVRELASRLKKLCKHGMVRPFVFADLRK